MGVSVARTVFHVDDDEAQRAVTAQGLSSAGFTLRSFASVEEFLARFEPRRPGCLLLDLRLSGVELLALQQTLAARGVALPVVVLAAADDAPAAVPGMGGGVAEFLTKPVRPEDLAAALERALERDAVQRAGQGELERRYSRLTPREREVFAAMVGGWRNKQAAQALGIAERTIKLHRARVLEKMGAESAAELLRMAERLRRGPARS